MAVIELKKAVSMNPHFCEAMNLLGLCYSYLGDDEKAEEMFDRVMKVESNSILASNYRKRFGLNEIAQPSKKGAKKPIEPKRSEPKKDEPLKRIRESKNPSAPLIPIKRRTLFSVLKIAGGFAAGFLIAFIIFSAVSGRRDDPSVPVQSTADQSTDSKTVSDSQYNELKNKVDSLQKEKENAVQQADYYKAALKLYDIEDLVKSRQYENAADMLLLLKTVAFKDGEKVKYDSLCQKVMPLAANIAYDQGYRLYSSRKYQDSVKEFEKVQTYDPQFRRMDATLYFMGRSCQALQDSRSAAALYQKLLTNYPKSSYARGAKAWLKKLTELP
jgi:TolA-binding protein